MHCIRPSACLAVVALSLGVSLPAVAAPPAAYVYIATTNGNSNQVTAFSAAQNGALTPIHGSPFAANASSMAVNGKYLYATRPAGVDIDAYRIDGEGALRRIATTNAEHNSCTGGSLGPIFFDHTGSSLYDLYNVNPECDDNFPSEYQSFDVEKSSGYLAFMGGNDQGFHRSALSFIGNNRFAYSASCDPSTSPLGPVNAIDAYERHSDGFLSYLNTSTPIPAVQPGEYGLYCPSLAAADPYNHVAFTMQDSQEESLQGPIQLATYTADSAGNLTTASTWKNMPSTVITSVDDLRMSPSGKLLAVAGVGGLQIFHFNGASPITPYTRTLLASEVNQIFWDNENHLYAISTSTNKIHVYTITPTAVTEAPGSPFTVNNPQSLVVQPKSPRPIRNY